MRSLSILLLIAAAFVANPALSDTSTGISVTAQAAVVSVEPLPEGRRLIPLPTLEFALIVKPQCAPDMQVDSISISVADTRTTLGASEIGGQTDVVTSIAIPRRQVSPLAVEGFCRLNQDDDLNPSDLLVKGALTANVSMRCADDSKQTIVYTSQALDLSLHCASEEQESDVAADQSPASSSIAR